MSANVKYNLPIKLDRSDYENCVNLIREEARQNPTVSSVYLMGGEWSLGISDLDIVVIYKDGLEPKTLRNPWSLSDKAKFIFTHRYLSFSENAAKYFYFLYPRETANLRHVTGTEQQFLAIPEQNRKWTLAFVLFDVLINKLLLFSKFKKESQNVRQLIGVLYSLVYTVWMVREISGKNIDNGFEVRIKKLRADWFILDKDAALQELNFLLEEGILLVSRAVVELSDFVSREVESGNSTSAENFKFSNEKCAVKFVDKWSHEHFIAEFSKSLTLNLGVLNKKVESFRLVLPTSLTAFFQAYAHGEGEFSRLMRRHISNAQNFSKIKSLEDHVKAVNLAYKSSVISQGLFKIPYAYGFSPGKQKASRKLLWKFIALVRDL